MVSLPQSIHINILPLWWQCCMYHYVILDRYRSRAYRLQGYRNLIKQWYRDIIFLQPRCSLLKVESYEYFLPATVCNIPSLSYTLTKSIGCTHLCIIILDTCITVLHHFILLQLQKLHKSCSQCNKNTWQVESNYILQPPKYLLLFVNRFRYTNNYVTKDRCSIPMEDQA